MLNIRCAEYLFLVTKSFSWGFHVKHVLSITGSWIRFRFVEKVSVSNFRKHMEMFSQTRPFGTDWSSFVFTIFTQWHRLCIFFSQIQTAVILHHHLLHRTLYWSRDSLCSLTVDPWWTSLYQDFCNMTGVQETSDAVLEDRPAGQTFTLLQKAAPC